MNENPTTIFELKRLMQTKQITFEEAEKHARRLVKAFHPEYTEDKAKEMVKGFMSEWINSFLDRK